MGAYLFDDRTIQWRPFGDFQHLQYHILNVDEQRNIIDALFKFAAREQIFLHRHKALNHLFVIQGEHRLYHADGSLKEVRKTGSYTVSPASDEPHREGGGDDGDVVILFSIRGDAGVLYEVLDDGQHVIATLTMQDFIGLFQAQQA